jgi:ribosomal protein S18 acetylase RimI-like enzyme
VTPPRWLSAADDSERAEAYELVRAVMERGGAVGWLGVPTRAESDEWLAGVLDSAAEGKSRVAVIGAFAAMGRWTRYDKPAVSLNAEILQVMVHPSERGRGLAGTLLRALVADAREHGVETLTLDVRGNNHAAMALYENVGFTVYGRLPDFVGVGDERWDRVLYRLDLRTGDYPVRRHGSRPVGAGSSVLSGPARPPIGAGPTLAGPPAGP